MILTVATYGYTVFVSVPCTVTASTNLMFIAASGWLVGCRHVLHVLYHGICLHGLVSFLEDPQED